MEVIYERVLRSLDTYFYKLIKSSLILKRDSILGIGGYIIENIFSFISRIIFHFPNGTEYNKW